MTEGRVVVVTGPPGAGKTSVARALVARLENGVLLDGDAFFRSIRNGWIPPWQPEADRQNERVIRAIGAAAAQFATGGYLVVVDGVIGPWFLKVFLEQVDIPVDYVVLRPSAEEAMRRAVARDSSELVDPKPISHMFDAFSDLGEYERFVVDSTDMEVEETAESASSHHRRPAPDRWLTACTPGVFVAYHNALRGGQMSRIADST